MLLKANNRMRPGRKLDDAARFLGAWSKNPLRTGAIAPSSRALARQMAYAAAANPGVKIVELGPGTGVVTDALLDAGVMEEHLTLIELNDGFANLLGQRYPKATVCVDDAFSALISIDRLAQPISAVVSSLPLFVYPKKTRQLLCEQALALVGPYGRLVQFTYGPVSPIVLSGQIRATRSRRIWGNLPPATVWTYQANLRPGACLDDDQIQPIAAE